MTYGKTALDVVRKFSYEAWLILSQTARFLHLCMGEDIHKLKTNLILLTGPGFFVNFDWAATDGTGRELLQNRDKQPASEKNQGSTKIGIKNSVQKISPSSHSWRTVQTSCKLRSRSYHSAAQSRSSEAPSSPPGQFHFV